MAVFEEMFGRHDGNIRSKALVCCVHHGQTPRISDERLPQSWHRVRYNWVQLERGEIGKKCICLDSNDIGMG
jgi:hypothetical protein